VLHTQPGVESSLVALGAAFKPKRVDSLEHLLHLLGLLCVADGNQWWGIECIKVHLRMPGLDLPNSVQGLLYVRQMPSAEVRVEMLAVMQPAQLVVCRIKRKLIFRIKVTYRL
jgi:hypothetical protein